MINVATTIEKIKAQLQHNPVLVYMKGSPKAPQCGFSAKVVQILDRLNVHYAYVDVLANPDIRATLPTYAAWPTFPQLYIQGELIGGCDIVSEMYAAQTLSAVLAPAHAMHDTPTHCLAKEA
ncbi:MAG: Grx4 family monothiol glutaredoxin [Gammaproteobacteria bacterium]|nr:Grx4 family monothiol glutaredoxin [Gammaproteobacteria bacterium]MBP9729003.1 Grx4 family monothiol glutaredoxin [Gammaproteobacteria bacterium]